MHWLAAFFLLSQLAFPLASGPVAQDKAAFFEPDASYQFGSSITFQVRVESSEAVRGVRVYITPEGQTTVWQDMAVSENGQGVQQVDVRRLPLVPFAEVSYRFEALFPDGSSEFSPEFQFRYEDNRFQWQVMENGTFRVHWYSAETTLGQEILNIAQRGLERASTLIDARLPAQLQIYAYASSSDLQAALSSTAQTWAAGHASPQLNLILISVPSGPEQRLELERQIPHEIFHILQYQVMGDSFSQQPTWLIEGQASLAELYPNPEYLRVLEATVEAQTLLPMQTLCGPFPRDASSAYQAYAQSESFLRFLQEKYGKNGTLSLIEQYRNGLGCEEGVQAAFGVPLSRLETRWKQEALGIQPGRVVLRNLSPYLLVGLFLLIPTAAGFYPYRRRGKRASRSIGE